MSVWVSGNGQPVVPQWAPVTKAEPYATNPGVDLLVVALRRLIGDTVTFALRAQGYHWNVMGPDFAQYHDLFQQVYEDAFMSLDALAENVRKLGAVTPFRLPELMALRTVTDEPVGSALPAALVADLLVANEQMLLSLGAAFGAAADANEQGIVNFLADRVEKQQKWSWQLRASLGG